MWLSRSSKFHLGLTIQMQWFQLCTPVRGRKLRNCYLLSGIVVWQRTFEQLNIAQEATSASLFTVTPLCGNLRATVYQPRSYVPGEHAATNISTAIQQMLSDWDIETEKIVAAVTDNAKNMVNAISNLATLISLYWPHTATLGEESIWCAKSPHSTCSSWKTSVTLS